MPKHPSSNQANDARPTPRPPHREQKRAAQPNGTAARKAPVAPLSPRTATLTSKYSYVQCPTMLVSGAPPVMQDCKLRRNRRVHCTSRVRRKPLNFHMCSGRKSSNTMWTGIPERSLGRVEQSCVGQNAGAAKKKKRALPHRRQQQEQAGPRRQPRPSRRSANGKLPAPDTAQNR